MTRVELIAEVSSNHGGDVELAKAFIWQCAEAGADWVKFQSYQVKHLRRGDPQRDWLAQAELSDDAHYILRDECTTAGVKFLTTVFTADRVPFLAQRLHLQTVKVGSGEAMESSLHRAIPPSVRVIASLGCTVVPTTVTGIQSLMVPLRWQWLRCVSRYPAPRWMCSQQSYVDSRDPEIVGWSDHCRGIDVCRQALSAGARIIEKHVCLPEQPRERRVWEATMTQLKDLRAFSDQTPEVYRGRWQHGV